MNRTTKAQGFCTPNSAATCIPVETKEQRIHLPTPGVPVWSPRKKRARRQRLKVRFGAMVAELSS
ncbi:hypothetical protein V1278_005292 [Bradyrhizobium sp. AZCC 1577]